MTAPTEDLIERLEAQSRYDRAHCPPSNPLDAEAAQALRSLQAEVERHRKLLISIVESPITEDNPYLWRWVFNVKNQSRSALNTGSGEG